MAAIKDIVKQEGERSEPRHYAQIHLFQEGSFVRAYEWSAWLLCQYVHEFKATRRVFRDIENPVAFVGFPKTSMEKFIPPESKVEELDEKHTAIALPMDISDEMLKQMHSDYESWKEKIPLTESAKERKSTEKTESSASSATLTDFLHRVMAFPLESKSPIDCMLFLAEIKKQMARMI